MWEWWPIAPLLHHSTTPLFQLADLTGLSCCVREPRRRRRLGGAAPSNRPGQPQRPYDACALALHGRFVIASPSASGGGNVVADSGRRRSAQAVHRPLSKWVGILVTSLLACHLCLSCKQDNRVAEPSETLYPSVLLNFVSGEWFAETVDEVTVMFQDKRIVVTNRCAIMAIHRLFKNRSVEDADEQWKIMSRRHPWPRLWPPFSCVRRERCEIQVHSQVVGLGRSTVGSITRSGTVLEMMVPVPGSPGKPVDYFRDDDQKLWRFLTLAPSRAAVGSEESPGGPPGDAAGGREERTISGNRSNEATR